MKIQVNPCFALKALALLFLLPDFALGGLSGETVAKAEGGDAYAQAVLATHYSLGWGVPKDSQLAFKLALASVDQDHALGCFRLGALYRAGEGVEKDEKLGLAFQESALAGLRQLGDDPYALTALGVLKFQGKAVPEDRVTAAKLYKTAADMGFAPAQFNFSMCAHAGHGMPKNLKIYNEYLNKAVSQGYPPALKWRDEEHASASQDADAGSSVVANAKPTAGSVHSQSSSHDLKSYQQDGPPVGSMTQEAEQRAVRHINDHSLLPKMEDAWDRGTEAPPLTLPSQLTDGSVEYIPEFGLLSPASPTSSASLTVFFRDTLTPSKYFAYTLWPNKRAVRSEMFQQSSQSAFFLSEIKIFHFTEGASSPSDVMQTIQGNNSAPGLRKTSLVNVFRFQNGVLNPPDPGDVDMLTPIYYSYPKFIEWARLAEQKRPVAFDKRLPNGAGIFRWTDKHNLKERQGEMVAFLQPLPPYGFQPGRQEYAGWPEEAVNDLMRAFYFYPSAMRQMKVHAEKNQRERKTTADEIDATFR